MLDLDPDHRSLPVPIYRGPRLAILAAAAVVVLAPFAYFYLGRSWSRWEQENFAGFLAGTIFSQAILAAFWSALGPGDGLDRRARAVAWLIPISITTSVMQHGPRVGLVIEAVVLFVYSLFASGILQLLLLPAAAYKWRLGLPAEGDIIPSGRLQWGIRHLLYLLTALGMLFGTMRLLILYVPPEMFAYGQWLVMAPIVSGMSLFLLLRTDRFSSGLYLAIAAGVVLLAAEGVADRIYPYFGRNHLPPVVATHGAVAMWSLVMGSLWRQSGLRLVRRNPVTRS